MNKAQAKARAKWLKKFTRERDPKRIDRVIRLLRALWKKVPDWRLGQIITNAAGDGDIYFMEEDAWEKGLRRLLDLHIESVRK